MDISAFLESSYTNKNILILVIIIPFILLLMAFIFYKSYKKYKKEKYSKYSKKSFKIFEYFVFGYMIPRIYIFIFGFNLFENPWSLLLVIPYLYLSIKFDKKANILFTKMTSLQI